MDRIYNRCKMQVKNGENSNCGTCNGAGHRIKMRDGWSPYKLQLQWNINTIFYRKFVVMVSTLSVFLFEGNATLESLSMK